MNDDSPPSDLAPGSNPAPPEASTIEILEQGPERLVLFIPAAPRRGWELGCFGLIWTTIISIISFVMLMNVGRAGGPDPKVFLFLTPFWLVGLTMLYFSLRMRHTRTLILVEPTRAVLQTTFFGRTTTKETTLTPGDPAVLVEAYRQNDVPVDSVCLKGDPRPLKFATALEHNEKAWIVDRINAFLQVTPAADSDDAVTGPMPTWVLPESCSACGGTLPPPEGEVQEVTCPFCGASNKAEMKLVHTGPSDTQSAVGDFPADRVTVVEQSPDFLEFGMRVFESQSMRRGAGIALGLFALFWNLMVGGFVWATFFGARFNPGSLIMLIFLLPFVGIGLAIACAALFIVAGRLRVRVDRDLLQASWGVGLLRYSKSFPTGSITHVTVENSPMAVKNRRARSSVDPDTRTAIVWAAERWIPVTMLQGVNDCRHVAELVRGQLSRMGFQVLDRRVPVLATPPHDGEDEEDEDDDDEDLAEEKHAPE